MFEYNNLVVGSGSEFLWDNVLEYKSLQGLDFVSFEFLHDVPGYNDLTGVDVPGYNDLTGVDVPGCNDLTGVDLW